MYKRTHMYPKGFADGDEVKKKPKYMSKGGPSGPKYMSKGGAAK